LRHVKRSLLAAVATLFLAQPALAAPPPVAARSYVVLNASTGEVLAARNPHVRVPIASITKLMTVLVALRHANGLEQQLVVGDTASQVGESTVHLRSGERISVGDLVEGALIQSANDAADALADGWGDRAAFVAEMNYRARALGLADTTFVRPDGLDAPGHLSSAWDVTRLAQVAMHNPFVRKTVRERDAVITGGRRLHTWNDLLGRFPGLIGVKTGHTGAAGWCQVAAAREPGTTIYATILGSPSRARRNADLAALLRWGLARYRVARVIEQGRPYALAAVGYGRAPLPLVAPSSAQRAVRTGRPLVARVVAPAAVRLPVDPGTRLGWVRVYEGKRLLAQRPLVAARRAERPGTLARVGFYAKRTAEHVWGWLA
jgi:serine-type D-Ala-D-Ala carboxypeptidase (penicillin-binding protein 5/6)